MILIGLMAAYATLLSLGFGITMLLMRGGQRCNAIECCCLSWFFGVGGVSMLLWLCGNFASSVALQLLITIVCVAIGFAGWKNMRRSTSTFALPGPKNLLEWVLAAVLALEIILVFSVALKTPLGWDGLLDWEIKARYAFLNGNVLPAHYYDSGRFFSHPDYPPAIPFTELWLYMWMGEANQFWLKTIFATFYAAGALVLALLSARLTGKRWAGLLAAIFLFFVPQLTFGTGSAIAGYVDFPIAVVYLATIGYLLGALASNSAHQFRIYAACLALLPWLKREGAVLWLIAALAGAIVIWKQRRPRLFMALLPGILVVCGWRFYLHALHVPSSPEFVPLSLTTLWANAGRVIPIWRGIIFHMADTQQWSVFWLVAAAGIVCLALRVRSLQSVILLGAALLPIAAYSFVYIFSAWTDYIQHAGASMPRLLMHVVPLLCVGIAISLSSPLRTQTHPRNLIP
jgi:hypothetical protein